MNEKIRNQPGVIILGLVVFSCVVQTVLIRRATVPSFDAVRFVEQSRQIDRLGLVEALRHGEEQPLFSVCVWLAHHGLDGVSSRWQPSWALSCQFAAAVPLVLAVVFVYLLGRRLVGPTAALAGAVLFSVLPEIARLGADGISDSTHLLFFCIASWCIATYLEKGSSLWLLWAGIAIGLAVLTRVEALILPTALAATLAVTSLLLQRRLVVAMGGLVLGIALVWIPYLVMVQSTTPRVAFARVLGKPGVSDPIERTTRLTLSDDETRLCFDVKEPSVSIRRRGYLSAVVMYGEELLDVFGYGVGVFVLIGLGSLRRQLNRPVDLLNVLYSLLFTLAAWYVAAREGYLEARHLATLTVVGVGCAGYGMQVVGDWILNRSSKRSSKRSTQQSVSTDERIGSNGVWVVLLGTVVCCLVMLAEPQNANQAGHRRAAEWLAREADESDVVLDTRGWTGLYTGRFTYRYREAQRAFGDPRLAYIVLECRELEYKSDRTRTLQRLLDIAAEELIEFGETDSEDTDRHRVAIYRWDAARFSRASPLVFENSL